ncbi:hypothetical protein RA2_04074 [Roseovarius sp. A-2]|uniref:head-tail joining protein n=1 Tax=Roseovarius sp. A-2 TaxID=1570360 RepID=UPI0009B596C3|nr:hypothetical protein [Roseovarius sp. A-2]GAW36999.1 hypothetical protein RA2_04074 [Roseovarius sp. A-2]
MTIAEDFLDAMCPVPATYSRGVDTAELRAAIQEADKAFKTSRRDQLIASDCSGVILRDALVRRGGRLTLTDGTEYRIDRVMNSGVPGLSDLALVRLNGVALPVYDASQEIPLDATVTLDGAEIPAHVNPSVEVEEIGDDGSRVVVSRIMVAIRAEDAAGARPGSVVVVDGEARRAARVMNDGLGMVKVLV